MPEYPWIWLNKQDSEYVWSPKYAKILNIEKFWIWQDSQYASVTQHSEYARIYLKRVLNLSSFLNMVGLKCKSSQDSKYATLSLNMSE